MSNDETTRVAIVTGGSRGIGRAVVEALADDGWRVYLCSRNPDSVQSALSELADRGSVQGRAVDVREQSQVEDFVAWVHDDAGRLDCLVNNAGLGHFGAPPESVMNPVYVEMRRALFPIDRAALCIQY